MIMLEENFGTAYHKQQENANQLVLRLHIYEHDNNITLISRLQLSSPTMIKK